jgi:pimeloyl-ACP methyl ester carboxylesterase
MPFATTSDQIRIHYDDLGQGETTILLLTAWCMSRHGYAQLPPKLAEKYRVLALDWRGHGQSDIPVDDFGAAALVEDAIAVIKASGAKNVTVVAMHHAGWVAIELRRRLGATVTNLVHLDWVVFPPPEPYRQLVNGLATAEAWQASRDVLFSIFTNGINNPPELVDLIKTEMSSYSGDMWMRSGREIAASFEKFGYPLNALAALTPPVPTLHLYGQPKDPGYLAAQEDFASHNPWFKAHQLASETFFSQFDAADEIVEAIATLVAPTQLISA